MALIIQFDGLQRELHEGEHLIGRAPECDIVITDREASRRHAKLTCSPMTCSVEDLGSSNGTFVNGTPVHGTRFLAPGDVIIIGHTELEVRPSGAPTRPSRRRAVTLDDRAALRTDEAGTTGQKDVIELLAGVAQRALDHGNPAQAEKVLGPVLAQAIDATRKGAPPPPDMVVVLCRHALTLADATGRAQWLDYVIETYWHADAPLPPPVLERLVGSWRTIQGHNEELLRAYVGRLRAKPGPMTGRAADTIAQLESLLPTP